MTKQIEMLGQNGWRTLDHPHYEGTRADWLHNDGWRHVLDIGRGPVEIAYYARADGYPAHLVIVANRDGGIVDIFTDSAHDALGLIAHWAPIVHAESYTHLAHLADLQNLGAYYQ